MKASAIRRATLHLHCSTWDYIKQVATYIISRELHVCATFSRTFFRTDLCLWPEDLPAGSVVLLSGRDDLIDAELALKMMQGQPHIKVGTAQLMLPDTLLCLFGHSCLLRTIHNW